MVVWWVSAGDRGLGCSRVPGPRGLRVPGTLTAPGLWQHRGGQWLLLQKGLRAWGGCAYKYTQACSLTEEEICSENYFSLSSDTVFQLELRSVLILAIVF